VPAPGGSGRAARRRRGPQGLEGAGAGTVPHRGGQPAAGFHPIARAHAKAKNASRERDHAS